MLVLNRRASMNVLLLAIGGSLAIGCAATPVTTPRSRVAQDLGCTTEGTKVDKIADIPGEKAARWQVTGCGRSAVYICTTPVRDCWREGEVGPTSAAPPPALTPAPAPAP